MNKSGKLLYNWSDDNFDEEWNICGKGYVEHDPIEIWNKTKESVAVALVDAGISAKDLRVIGFGNQGETCMVWDKKIGNPIYNAIVWQDRRTAKIEGIKYQF